MTTTLTHLNDDLDLQTRRQELRYSIRKLKLKLKTINVHNILLTSKKKKLNNTIINLSKQTQEVDNKLTSLQATKQLLNQEIIQLNQEIEKIDLKKKIFQIAIDNEIYKQILTKKLCNNTNIQFIRNIIDETLLSLTDEYIANNINNNYIIVENKIIITLDDIEVINRIRNICTKYKMKQVQTLYKMYEYKITHSKLIHFVLNEYLKKFNSFNFS